MTDTRGNFATMFALASMALVGGAGVALDYNNMVTMRSDLQAQTDAAVLSLATNQNFTKFTGRTKTRMQDYAHKVMIENGYPADGPKPTIKTGPKGAIRVEANLEYTTGLTRIMGFKKMPVAAGASSFFVSINDLDIALALDVTASMGFDGKLDALKLSANQLVDSIAATGTTKVKISLVPFAQYVNVGMTNRTAPWITVPADGTRTENYQYQPRRQTSSQTCTGTEPYSRTYYVDGVAQTYNGTRPTGCTGTNTWVDDGPEETRTRTITETWSGCVGSRGSNLHLVDATYSTRVPGLMNTSCPNEILPLTNDYAAVKTAIDNLTDAGNTYLPAGLAWGQRVLSPGAPYSEGKANSIKYLVLMTDGENTLSLNVPKHDGSDWAATNTDTARLCTNIKGDDVTIFTIAFKVTDTATRNMLRTCATNNGTYFEADDDQALKESFAGIANSVLSARLTQ